MATVAQTISYGEATVFLMSNEVANGVMFPTLYTQVSCVMVAIVTDSLKWQNEELPSDSTLQGTSAYLYWLCGKFQLQARALTGGGSVTPLPPTVNIPNPIEFVVTDTSFISNGENSIVIPQYIGYNLIFNRNNVSQSQVNTGGTYFTWNKVTGLFTCIGAASTDELFSLNPA